jgi:hypothetical protein
MTSALATITANGDVTITITLDIISYALNDTSERIPDDAMNALLDGPEPDLREALTDASDRLSKATHLTPGAPITSIHFPSTTDIQNYLKTNPHPRLPVIMTSTLHAHLSPNSTTISLRFPEILGTIILTIERPDEEPAAVAIDPDRWSDPVQIHLKPKTPTTTP